MATTIVLILILIVAGSVPFHLYNPWALTHRGDRD
jgi:hypothetical protein